MPTTGLEPVRPFEHWSLKPACLPIPARGRSRFHFECSGRDSNPHGVNPHRILNPARLPIPPPELSGVPVHHNGAEGSRTPDLLNAIQALSQLSYGPNSANVSKRSPRKLPARRRAAPDGPPGKLVPRPIFSNKRPTGLTGLEPAASGVTDRHSNQTELQPQFFLPGQVTPADTLTGNRTPISTLKEWCPNR